MSRGCRRLLVLLLAAGATGPSVGQDSFRLTDENTQIQSVRFRFIDHHVFEAEQLAGQMVTRGPGFGARLKRRFSFLPWVTPPTFLLDPIELQRDMARLRRFYLRNGFLAARVDYPDSQFRRSSNRIRVIVTVKEGPPLSIARRNIIVEDGIPPDHNRDWERVLERIPREPGTRYTEFDRLQLESQVRSFWRDRGYAFADVATDVRIDSTNSQVGLQLRARLGPRSRIGSISVEGVSSVSQRVVLRELPFSVGDWFSSDDLVEGQRELFGLNLFRVALLDVANESPDSLVTIRVRLREAPTRYMDVQSGYSREDGATVGASWRHRNFLGGARQLSLTGNVHSGLFARPPADRIPIEQYSGGISVRQPYVSLRNLSASVGLTGRLLDDENLGTRYREAGVTPSLVYEILPFRTAAVRYSVSQAKPLNSSTSLAPLGLFSQDVFAATLTAGRLNNYLSPSRGWIVRPTFEVAGTLFGEDVAYLKGYVDAFAYVPLTRQVSLSLTLRAGRLSPRGTSRNQSNPDTEFRFDDIRFYAGGANDVRGWGLNAVGPQFARADSVYRDSAGNYLAEGARYEPVGGLGKVAGSVEILLPAPFLGSSWRAAVFADFGGVAGKILRDAEGRALMDANEQPLLNDTEWPALGELSWGGGTGLRFNTPVGAVRFDLAYKLNPRESDLRDPGEEVLFDRSLGGVPSTPARRRMNFHLSIRRAF